MHIAKVCLTCIAGLALSGAASAEIYESKDAQGNAVFTDRPSQGAEQIKVPPTNSADPVQDIPALDPPAETASAPKRVSTRTDGEERQDPEDDYYYYGGADDENADTRRERRHDRDLGRPGDPPRVEHHGNARNTARSGGGGGRR